MRLINAEWLKKYVRKVGIYCDTDADKEYTCKKIDEFPTVEAIPVEWLEDFRDGLDMLSESQLMRAIDLIIDAYRVEKKREEE